MKAYEMVIYRGMIQDKIFAEFAQVIDGYEEMEKAEISKMMFEGISGLIQTAQSRGFSGNLWHVYLTFLLANDENSYSRFCEKKGCMEGSMKMLLHHDMEIIKYYMDFDWKIIENKTGVKFAQLFEDFIPAEAKGIVFNRVLRDRIDALAVKLANEDVDCMCDEISNFYGEYGVGKFGLHKAFRVQHEENGAKIVPIVNSSSVMLDDLVGYDIQKQQLIDNTEAFVNGKKANNVLLYGDSGTGKSTSIKAILNQYYKDGLRMIEIYKHQFQDLNSVIAQIKDRNYKFIIYMDDLSFEESELEYKYLKAVIEGGLEIKPDNVLIYATSNRRHLVKETWDDQKKIGDDIHGNDSKQEKLSLFARFGVAIYYGSPVKKEFLNIVHTLAEREGIDLPWEVIEQKAIRWELTHGGFSGRAAQQVITHLKGTELDTADKKL
ncbi:MAG: ATP-binding protein [Lachnospiraceae bacterium]|nr:ATP-binding protein [Lachnospiraceae bacterium]